MLFSSIKQSPILIWSSYSCVHLLLFCFQLQMQEFIQPSMVVFCSMTPALTMLKQTGSTSLLILIRDAIGASISALTGRQLVLISRLRVLALHSVGSTWTRTQRLRKSTTSLITPLSSSLSRITPSLLSSILAPRMQKIWKHGSELS